MELKHFKIGRIIKQVLEFVPGLIPGVKLKRGLTLNKFNSWVENLNNTNKLLREYEKDRVTLVPAGEWLLDNIYFIKEQALQVQKMLSERQYRKLPRLRNESQEVRIFAICQKYLKQTDGPLEVEKIVAYIKEIQEVSVLRMDELWAVPLFLRVALIEQLASVFSDVQEQQMVYQQAAELFETWKPLLRSPAELKQALERSDESFVELDPSFVTYMAARLRNYAEDTTLVQDWLERRAENMGVNLKSLVAFELQRQAQYKITAGNLVNSLRALAHWVWQDHFESLCQVEQTLRQDPAGVYHRMDFASRNYLRQVVEKSARRIKVSENRVAQTALALAVNAATSEEVA